MIEVFSGPAKTIHLRKIHNTVKLLFSQQPQ